MSQKAKGALLGYVAIVVGIVSALIFTPVLVAELGTDNYGILNLAMAFVAYISILDLGMNDSLLRFFVKHRGSTEEKEKFLGRMLFTYVLVGFFIISVVWLLAESFVSIFAKGLTLDKILVLEEMFKIVGVGAAIMIASNPLSSLIYAEERFVFLRSLEIFTSVLSIVVIYLLLINDYGLIEIAWSMCAFKVFTGLCRFIYVSNALKFRIRLALPQWPELRKILLYGAPIFAAAMMGPLFHKIDHILIGSMVGAAAVSIYAIGVMFNKYVMSLTIVITRVFTPDIIRKIDSGISSAEILSLLVRISRIQALFIYLVLGGVVVFGQQFLVLWLNEDFALSYYVLLFVLLPFSLEIIGNSRNIVLQVKEAYWYRSLTMVIMAIINIILTLLLLPRFGVIGAAVGTGAALLIGYVILGGVLQAKAEVSFLKYIKGVYGKTLPVNAVMVCMALWLTHGITFTWLTFAGAVVLYSVMYVAVTYILLLNRDERALIGRLLNRKQLTS
ncbi:MULTISPECIES: lipopolysaccharide biosynthesis protein [Idiomarina]|uniref:lipopolysaccharide biosynthesis protein n=1 Tax=Idiomarina TaxID=135575 RepID=UPI00129CFBAF|nr:MULTISPECIES: oligosaccharide flippase family protein [Idiomarina]MRJ42534.1 oligosaccharide flippase family protein [Idiomarina sp. FeN1]NCU58147.1 oligosaccharide flippase family protein [Idiomarina sp. FenA--70]NCU60845.1 oligosaccharide flippase family protein [Idiomarina sp. FenBw--71]UUN12743.1 oligosaccharide flippase family protein [Idiomarina loihiensis]